jgi:hypothetical protein
MRRNWLAHAALAGIALSVPVAGGAAQAAQLPGQQVSMPITNKAPQAQHVSLNLKVATVREAP